MSPTPPDALLFITPVCKHCPPVLQALGELVKQTKIGKLTVVNIAAHPEQAAEYDVRGAPWVRLGSFTLTGAQSIAELKQWAEWASGDEGTAHYIEHLLKEGDYKHAVAFIAGDTRRLKSLLAIVADPDANISVRLGVSALLEAYANKPELQALLPQLADLSRHFDHRVRADACHLLGQTGSVAAREYVAACLEDENDEVREIAEDALQELGMKR
ncbi:MAG: HEAT repeat domain-containing protein [Gammaproteobacteria bacterium]|nr:HEAT repeat domain-containing protein [Gammaproteobacteria bacterium]MBU1969847.1 HEAT repeat domain-containing protein [Gammaproteobacteria bacterium]